MATNRDEELRDRAIREGRKRDLGVEWGLRIIEEARREDILISMGFALIEKESSFKNVWGHDRDKNGNIIWPGREGDNYVTEAEYREYKRRRGHGDDAYGHMQGCGLTQLTWWESQNAADREGGCWVPRYQCRIGFRLLKNYMDAHGTRKGLAVYNGGTNPPARSWAYADSVMAKQDWWHDHLS